MSATGDVKVDDLTTDQLQLIINERLAADAKATKESNLVTDEGGIANKTTKKRKKKKTKTKDVPTSPPLSTSPPDGRLPKSLKKKLPKYRLNGDFESAKTPEGSSTPTTPSPGPRGLTDSEKAMFDKSPESNDEPAGASKTDAGEDDNKENSSANNGDTDDDEVSTPSDDDSSSDDDDDSLSDDDDSSSDDDDSSIDDASMAGTSTGGTSDDDTASFTKVPRKKKDKRTTGSQSSTALSDAQRNFKMCQSKFEMERKLTAPPPPFTGKEGKLTLTSTNTRVLALLDSLREECSRVDIFEAATTLPDGTNFIEHLMGFNIDDMTTLMTQRWSGLTADDTNKVMTTAWAARMLFGKIKASVDSTLLNNLSLKSKMRARPSKYSSSSRRCRMSINAASQSQASRQRKMPSLPSCKQPSRRTVWPSRTRLYTSPRARRTPLERLSNPVPQAHDSAGTRTPHLPTKSHWINRPPRSSTTSLGTFVKSVLIRRQDSPGNGPSIRRKSTSPRPNSPRSARSSARSADLVTNRAEKVSNARQRMPPPRPRTSS